MIHLILNISHQGDNVEIIKSYPNGWSKGKCNKEFGYFPTAFVLGADPNVQTDMKDQYYPMTMECNTCKKKGGVGVDLMRCSKCKSAL